MAQPQFQEKTEQATPKRRQEARRKGRVAKSRDLSAAAVLGAALALSYLAGDRLAAELGHLLSRSLAAVAIQAHQDADMATFAWMAVVTFLQLLAPLMAILLLAAVLANLLQVGFVFSLDPITPRWSKIDPVQGAKRMLSLQALVELTKSLAKITLVGTVVFLTLKGEMDHLLPLLDMGCSQISSYMGRTTLKLLQRGFWAMLLLGLLDYCYQRWEFDRNLKMTKQEVKEEHKQTEGDPQIKARVRALQRQMARSRMMAEVPKADVVITNPQHLAVALRYDAKTMTAPTVVAKGAGYLAERIKAIAAAHQVPVIENKPLAQNLYRGVDINEEIPAALYQAVAEILAHVYRVRERLANG